MSKLAWCLTALVVIGLLMLSVGTYEAKQFADEMRVTE